MDSLSSDRRHFPTTRAVAYGAQAAVLRIIKRIYLSAPVRIIESSDNRGSDNRGSTVYKGRAHAHRFPGLPIRVIIVRVNPLLTIAQFCALSK